MEHIVITETTSKGTEYVWIESPDSEGGLCVIGKRAMIVDYCAGPGGQWDCEYRIDDKTYYAGSTLEPNMAEVEDDNGSVFKGTKHEVEEFMIEMLANS